MLQQGYSISCLRKMSSLRVSVMISNDHVHDLLTNQNHAEHGHNILNHVGADFDVCLACTQFPCIITGNSPSVELYDGTTRYENEISILSNVNFSILETSKKLSTSMDTESQHYATFMYKAISCIPGLRKKQQSQLESSGFHTLGKLLHHFPRSYANLQNVVDGVVDGQHLVSVGKVLSSRGVKVNHSFSFVEVVVECESQPLIDEPDTREIKTIYLHLKKFFYGSRFGHHAFVKHLLAKYKSGEMVCVSGKVRKMPEKDHYEMKDYNIDVLKDGDGPTLHVGERPIPIYSSKRRLIPNFLRNMISRAIQSLPANVDPIPREITQELGLPCLHDLGRFFKMLEGVGDQLNKVILLYRHRHSKLIDISTNDWSSLTLNVLKALPYSLTSSQQIAVSEIICDLKLPIPMKRLLQGDVGCGKTVVAFLACMEVISSGFQAAFMTSTELLAMQHYEHFLKLLSALKENQLKPSVTLLTGSTPLKISRMIREKLKSGAISMVVGTHSLISDNVEFSSLRITVVDEQHRFGVIQRGRFNNKVVWSSAMYN